MSNILGSTIMKLRKENDLTQEQLAALLGISYQAVSKWETGNSCPDISMLPLLADLFQVSIDTLFGRDTSVSSALESNSLSKTNHEKQDFCIPWPDDDCFYAVLFHGHELIGHSGGKEADYSIRQNIEFVYEGPAKNICSDFSVTVEGSVNGSVTAGSDVQCENVGESIKAGGNVSCEDVGGSVISGGNVSCEDVGGSVNADGNIDCSDISESASAGNRIECGDVGGNATAGNNLNCGDVGGNVSAGANVHCADVEGSIYAGSQVISSD